MRNKKLCETNIYQIGNEFVNFFYTNWTNDLNINEIIENYSKLVYNNTNYIGLEIINILKIIKNENIFFTNCKCEFFDTHSRQIYILVLGELNNLPNNRKNFSQSFLLSFSARTEKWILINSMLIIN